MDYEQRKGVAMGKAFAPAYANIFMAEWEQRLFSVLPDDLVPSLWRRFIDDCLGTLEGSESDLAEFLHIANSIDPNIQLTATSSHSEIHFLDLTIFRDAESLGYRLYRKPTDTLMFVQASSMHPPHLYRGIAKSQFLRVLRNCSTLRDQAFFCRELQTALHARGYSLRTLRWAFKQAVISYLNPTPRTSTQADILVLEYHHNLQHLPQALREVWLTSQTDPLLAPLFPRPPMIAWRRATNLKQHLVRAHLR
jgi:hypothetical protein